MKHGLLELPSIPSVNAYRIVLIVIVLWGVLTVCYAQGKQYTGVDNQSSQGAQSLDERVRAFWQAREAGDFVAAYEYEEIKTKNEVSLRNYVRKVGLSYRQAKVLHTEIVGEGKAVAHILVEAVVPGLPDPIVTQLKDPWVLIDGHWYHGRKSSEDRARKHTAANP
jgi:hypothetical protein